MRHRGEGGRVKKWEEERERQKKRSRQKRKARLGWGEWGGIETKQKTMTPKGERNFLKKQ